MSANADDIVPPGDWKKYHTPGFSTDAENPYIEANAAVYDPADPWESVVPVAPASPPDLASYAENARMSACFVIAGRREIECYWVARELANAANSRACILKPTSIFLKSLGNYLLEKLSEDGRAVIISTHYYRGNARGLANDIRVNGGCLARTDHCLLVLVRPQDAEIFLRDTVGTTHLIQIEDEPLPAVDASVRVDLNSVFKPRPKSLHEIEELENQLFIPQALARIAVLFPHQRTLTFEALAEHVLGDRPMFLGPPREDGKERSSRPAKEVYRFSMSFFEEQVGLVRTRDGETPLIEFASEEIATAAANLAWMDLNQMYSIYERSAARCEFFLDHTGEEKRALHRAFLVASAEFCRRAPTLFGERWLEGLADALVRWLQPEDRDPDLVKLFKQLVKAQELPRFERRVSELLSYLIDTGGTSVAGRLFDRLLAAELHLVVLRILRRTRNFPPEKADAWLRKIAASSDREIRVELAEVLGTHFYWEAVGFSLGFRLLKESAQKIAGEEDPAEVHRAVEVGLAGWGHFLECAVHYRSETAEPGQHFESFLRSDLGDAKSGLELLGAAFAHPEFGPACARLVLGMENHPQADLAWAICAHRAICATSPVCQEEVFDALRTALSGQPLRRLVRLKSIWRGLFDHLAKELQDVPVKTRLEPAGQELQRAGELALHLTQL